MSKRYAMNELRSYNISDTSDSSDEEDGESDKPLNAFKNDGSFLETFRKMQEAQSQAKSGEGEVADSEKNDEDSTCPNVTKRRAAKTLPTGKVKKLKGEEEEEPEESVSGKDAWSQYMTEVKKYRERSCEEEGKTRPLVK